MIDESVHSERFCELPVDIPLAEQLEEEHDLGTEIEEGGFYARVADSPIGYSVSGIFHSLGVSTEQAGKLYERFNVWLIPHRVSIIRRSGLSEPTSVGIEVNYQNDGKTCSIVSLFPSFEFIQLGKVEVSCHAKMSASGDLISASTADIASTESSPSAKYGASMSAKVGTDLGLMLNASVVTPVVSCVGAGSSHCEWRFNKATKPLFGTDIETWAMVVLPKRQTTVKYDIRFYFNARTAFFNTRRQSNWMNINCALFG